MVTRQIRVRGRVQGVGYRAALQDEAQKLGLTGWVRNRSDGSVEALVQGSPESLDAIVAWARRGPRGAHVADVVASDADHEPEHARFELRPTL
jgi:acylphosphatase